MVDALPNQPPFEEVEHHVVIGERIRRGEMVAMHPRTNELVRAGWVSATICGVAGEDLPDGEVARFNAYAPVFMRLGTILVPTPVYQCKTCKDGADIPGGDFECPNCHRTVF